MKNRSSRSTFKRISATLLCIILCITPLFITADSVGTSALASADNAVFVKDGGTGDGSSAAKAMGSLVSAVTALSETGGTVVVCGPLTVTASTTTPATDYPVTVTSCFGGVDYRKTGAVLTYSINHLYHKGSVNYEYINIESTEKLNIYYHYNSYTIGEGVVTSYSGNATRYPIIFSGYYATSKTTPATVSNTQDTVATINSGTWYSVLGGNYREVSASSPNRAIGTNSGRSALIINGGTFNGTSSSFPVSATGMNYFSGDVYLEINGGSFSCPVYAVMRFGDTPTNASLVGERCSSGDVLVRIRGGSFEKTVGLTANCSNSGDNAYNVNVSIDGDSTFVITGGTFTSEFITYCACGDLLLKYDPTRLQENFLDLCGNLPIRQIIDADDEPDTQSEFVSATLNQQIDKEAHGADPYVIKDPNDDCYYYVYSSGGVKITKSGNIGLFKQGTTKVSTTTGIKSFSTIRNAVKAVDASLYSGDQPCTQYWAPEIHYIPREIAGDNYGWYCYVAASDSSGEDSAHRMYVFKSPDPDNPMCTGWTLMGKITDSSNYWAIDGTVVMWGGKMYFAWSGRESSDTSARKQSIYIAEMSNPWTLSGERVLISSPDQSWERYQTNPAVNEGPQAFTLNGKLYITYSANGSWAKNYCFGLLEYKGSGSLTVASNWIKRTSGPFFSRNSSVSTSPYGTGHGTVTTAVDGTPWLIFHANPTTETSSDANWWSRRMIYAQPLTLGSDGSIIANYANSTTAQNTIAAHNGECCKKHLSVSDTYPYDKCLYCAERQYIGILGDIDCDRTVANSDIASLVRYLSGWGTPPEFCDLNGDKKINNRDAIALIVKISGKA